MNARIGISTCTHSCAVPACRIMVPTRMFFCRGHWNMVPAPLKERLGAAVKDHQEGSLTDDELRVLQQLALNAVVAAEGEHAGKGGAR